MKKARLCIATITAILLLCSGRCCFAEKIYYNDGRSISASISYVKNGAVWVKYSGGAFGVDFTDIEKIDNDDGTVSIYDHKRIAKNIEASIAEKKYDDAIKWCDFLLGSYPDNAEIRFLRAGLYQKGGNLSAARDDYEYLVKNSKANVDICNNLGVIYAEEKRYDEAINCFNEALKIEPKKKEAINNLKALASRREKNK